MPSLKIVVTLFIRFMESFSSYCKEEALFFLHCKKNYGEEEEEKLYTFCFLHGWNSEGMQRQCLFGCMVYFNAKLQRRFIGWQFEIWQQLRSVPVRCYGITNNLY